MNSKALVVIAAIVLLLPFAVSAAPEQDFSVQNSWGDGPLTVIFEGYTNVTNITGYEWSYYQSVPKTPGWINFSTQQNCNFTFTTPGVYYIRFTTYSQDLPEGYLITSKSNQIYVFPLPTPTATPTQSPTVTPTPTPTPTPTGTNGIAVFRPANGNWYFDNNRDGILDKTVHFGTIGDIPATADLNNDGLFDLIIFRPANGNWYFDTDRNGVVDFAFHFGTNGDIPFVGRWN